MAAVAITLSACSTDDLTGGSQGTTTASNQENSILEFDNYVGQSTRAEVYTLESLQKPNVGVGIYAFYTKDGKKYNPAVEATDNVETKFSANFMNNVHLTYDQNLGTNDTWSYSPLLYWPGSADEYLSFISYAPYVASMKLYTIGDNGTPTEGGDNAKYLKYDVQTDKSKMIDQLYGEPRNNQQHYYANGKWYNTKNFYDYKNDSAKVRVHLNFKHALSRLQFAVYSSALADGEFDDADASDEVKTKYVSDATITINKVMFVGDSASAFTSNPVGAFTPTAYLNLDTTDTKSLWTNQATSGKLVLSYDNTSTVETVRGEDPLFSYHKDASGTTIQDRDRVYYWRPGYYYSKDTDENPRNVIKAEWDGNFSHSPYINAIGNGSNNNLFVIPQDFSKDTEGSDKLYFYLDYTIRYKTGGTELTKTTGINYRVCRRIKQEFKPGKVYTVYINISGNQLNPIEFYVTTNNWAPDNETQIVLE